jgi:beta-RFAP synthase
MKRRVEVRTHCRLHFGLTSLGHDADRPQFGGVGAMVAAPGVELEITAADKFHATGSMSDRVITFADSIVDHLQLPTLPQICINVRTASREHTGLGVGTQLGLAVAAGIAEAMGFPWRDPVRLAQLTRRGRRSAIGTYGFLLGGFIVDAGHFANEPLGRLAFNGEFPSEWRFLMISTAKIQGRAGLEETRTIAALPAVPIEVSTELVHITQSELIPALETASYDRFCSGLYKYGCLAGKCFAPAQGGIFSSPETARLIAWLRAQGITGVGQSSWGPTVFALLPDQTSAEHLREALLATSEFRGYETLIAPPANTGASIQVTD